LCARENDHGGETTTISRLGISDARRTRPPFAGSAAPETGNRWRDPRAIHGCSPAEVYVTRVGMDRRWSGEEKYRALLSVAEAANSRRDLTSVLEAMAAGLEPLVAVDLMGVVTHEGEDARARAIYVRSDPRGSRKSPEYIRRFSERTGGSGDRWKHTVFVRDTLERDRRTFVLDHIGSDPRLDTAALKHVGAECAVFVPLMMGDRFVAALVIARTTPSPFSPEEVAILEDVSRPVTTAVANAIAFEEIERLRARLEEENIGLREELAMASTAGGGIMGSSAALRTVLERVRLVAATDSTVLITGETGTGKELIARAIHAASPRAKRTMVKVNCAALPEALVAAELFGHEKGAFTGAVERRRGRFELAAGGTMFLDEVGELPPPVQIMLLRVLQEREFERVGGSETLRTDARVVAATNRDLGEAAHLGNFRADLLFRLNVFPIHVPALRERVEDIPILAEYWLSRYAREIGKPIRAIDASAMAALRAYSWPGNIRELQNVIQRAVILAPGRVLSVSDFELPKSESAAGRRTERSGGERQQIEQALAASRGRVYGTDGAAEALGVPPSTLEARIRRLGIDKHAFRHRARER
jgi:formate hydrogenlyase transcriptional activator